MRATFAGQVAAIALVLSLSGAVVAAQGSSDQDQLPIQGVTGTITLDPAASLGTFVAGAGVQQHRDVPMGASSLAMDDPRLNGHLDATWNWDVDGSGTQPVPAWGTMRISQDDSAWTGTFTGIRRHDFEPFTVRAFLVGEGAYEGLCAVLDIEADAGTWALDGVIHPLPVSG